MMASLSEEEEDNYLRLALLLKGVAPRAVRIYFDSHFPPTFLPITLNTNYNTLVELKLKGFLNQAHWNLLFPIDGVPDSTTFDVAMMICLIRNLSLIAQPINGYDSLPLNVETSHGADLARIKWYRNILAHHGSNEIPTSDFNTAWSDISDAISRLAGHQMHQECQDLKLKILDASNQDIMLEIKQSQEEMKKIKQTINSLETEVTEDLKKFIQDSHITFQTKYTEDIDRSRDPIPRNIRVDPDYLLPFAGTSEEFSKLLSTGTYESFENRVFLCGSCACGKSTLASVLIGTPIPLTWESTNGLVIHFGRNGINLETYDMVPLTKEVRGHNVLTKLVIGNPNREANNCQSVDTNRDQHMEETNITQSTSISPPTIKKIEAYSVHEDILKEVKSGQYKIKITPSDLVDFGGQRSYDMTHQLFVQHGGTFVVMFDGSRDFHDPLKEYPT